MGKRYLEPTSYRDKKCPYCGLYFSPRGLSGHMRFKHSMGYSDSAFERFKQEEKLRILSNINTEEGLKDALRLFLTEYLTK